MTAPSTHPTGMPDLSRWTDLVRDSDLDGWLVADFRWSSPVFGRLLGLQGGILTRRCFLWLPATGTGEPEVFASQVDGHTLAALDCKVSLYRGFQDMRSLLAARLAGCKRIAMEYSPDGVLPTLSRVDAGLIEMVRGSGVEVVTSGPLVAALEVWTDRQQDLHRRAARVVDAARAEALRYCFARLDEGQTVTEGEVASTISAYFRDRGMAGGDGPDVAVNANAADPHYSSAGGAGAEIGRDDVLLIDLWCKVADAEEAPFADSTWMAFTGTDIPSEYQRVFEVVRSARDAAIGLLQQRSRDGEPVTGAEADRSALAAIERAGMTAGVIHRTGHSLGTDHVHGMGTNLDAIEFPDDRPILSGTGFTVEPGLYLPGQFGVRLEVSAIMQPDGPEITTALQETITTPGDL